MSIDGAKGGPNWPEPEFTNSKDLRLYLNDIRRGCHIAAMLLHIGASEVEAALETIAPISGPFSKTRAKRRARRVAKHLRHAAACMVAAGAASVRTWGVFRAEYEAELSPAKVRGKRRSFRVVPE
ncbi:hypothetical protein [Longispora albida]|uniref:hypothetical protein n=1 Tax=Longispora albida TaxID=203523 RepID=UPI0003715B71|nr:hypothetical protein [Longispora albida]